MTHPDIESVERYGYTDKNRCMPCGVCLFCGSDIYKDGERHIKSFDGMFCDEDCCHSYYEIETME